MPSEQEPIIPPDPSSLKGAEMVKALMGEKSGETERLAQDLEDRLNARSRELHSSLVFDFEPPASAPELSQEQFKVIEDFFGEKEGKEGGKPNLEARYLPTAGDLKDLADKYSQVMYPAEDPARQKRDADNHQGLVTWRPESFGAAVSIKGFDFQGETWEKALPRFMREELNILHSSCHPLILIETLQKPNYIDGSQHYGTKEGTDPSKDPLLPFLREVFGEDANRFNHYHNKLTEILLPRIEAAIKAKFEERKIEPPNFKVVLVPASISNLEMTLFHPENSTTTSWEWNSTVLTDKNRQDSGRRLFSGRSDVGGASVVGDGGASGPWDRGGCRLAVVFPKN